MKEMQKQSIYVDACKLRRLLKLAQFAMTKADRVVYGTPVLQKNGDVIADFVMAYDFKEERQYYIRKMCADFEVLKADLHIICEDNVIKCADKDHASFSIDGFKVQIFDLIAKIDTGISKWRCDKGQERVCVSTRQR